MKKSTLIRILQLLIKYDVKFIKEIKNFDTYDDYVLYTHYANYTLHVMPFDDWNYLKEVEWEIYEELEQD